MSGIEKTHVQRERNRKLQALVLGSVAIGGGLAIALLAPNVLSAMGKLGLAPKSRQDEYISAARKRLKKQGLLVEHDGRLSLTSKGSVRLSSLAVSLARPVRKKRWDTKWRILIFDIPERRRSTRFNLRRQLLGAGFMRVQDSVWIYPHPCEEFVALLKSGLRVGKDVLYMIVDSLEGDTRFRAAFGLPLDGVESIKVPAALDSILEVILPKR